jgi:Big-like domain-containing protein
MSHTTPSFVRSALVLLLAGSIGCAGSDLLLPEPPCGGDNVSLTKFGGDAQEGTVGEPLQNPLVVQVLTERQQPACERKVAFMLTAEDPAAGTVAPDTAVTDSEGKATAHWTLGTALGDHIIVAQLVENEAQVAEFRAGAKAATPDTLNAASPRAQPGRRGREVATAPVVRVVDRYGNSVQGVSVAWQVTAGEGQVEQPIVQTDASGQATTKWTLGNRIGIHKLNATIGDVTGSPVTFTATVLF